MSRAWVYQNIYMTTNWNIFYDISSPVCGRSWHLWDRRKSNDNSQVPSEVNRFITESNNDCRSRCGSLKSYIWSYIYISYNCNHISKSYVCNHILDHISTYHITVIIYQQSYINNHWYSYMWSYTWFPTVYSRKQGLYITSPTPF